MYRVAWVYVVEETDHEIYRIEAATRPDLLAGVASALRKDKIKSSHEVRILSARTGTTPTI